MFGGQKEESPKVCFVGALSKQETGSWVARHAVQFQSFARGCPVSLTPLLKLLSFPHCIFFAHWAYL